MSGDATPQHGSYHFADCEWNFPLLELHCAGHVVRLPPYVWRQFAYFTVYMADRAARSATRVVALQLEWFFMPFVSFVLHRRAAPLSSSPTVLYTAALELRELVLMFGVRPGSTMETRAEMTIHEYLNEYASHEQAWSLLKLGFSHTFDDSRLGIGATVMRCSRLRDLLYTALLPLHAEPIDIMNSDVLAKLREQNENNLDDSSREGRVCAQLRALFDQRTYGSLQPTTSLFGL